MMNKKIENFFREDINFLNEYKILDSKGMIKLDAMENPFDLGANFKISNLSSGLVNLNRYPDANSKNLRNQLQKKYNLNSQKDVIIGNGSDELIQLICLAFLKIENTVLCPSPSFSMYKSISKVIGLNFEEVPLKEDFSLDINLMLNKIDEFDPAIIFLAYPNNPTGNLWSKEDIISIIKKSNGVVVIDEAYGDFSGSSFIESLNNYENLLIMKTFSKIGLAGIRLGYLFGDKCIIENINKLRLPFNINSLSQKISELAIENNQHLEIQINEICELRDKLLKNMKEINEIRVFESKTNFVLFKALSGTADDIFKSLLSDKILIKNMTNAPGLKNCLRVTVGSENENKLFIQSLKNAIK